MFVTIPLKTHDHWFEIFIHLFTKFKPHDKYIHQLFQMISINHFKNNRFSREQINSLRVVFLSNHLSSFETYLLSIKKFKKSEILKKKQECTYTAPMSFSLFLSFLSYFSISSILFNKHIYYVNHIENEEPIYISFTKDMDFFTYQQIENKNDFFDKIEKMRENRYEIEKIGKPIYSIHQYTLSNLQELTEKIFEDTKHCKKNELYEKIKKEIPCFFFDI